MSYDLVCKPQRSLSPSFRSEAVAYLRALHPAFSAFDPGPDPLSGLEDDPLFSDIVTKKIQVLYEGKDLPLEFVVYDDKASVSLGMGALGAEAQKRVERALAYVFAFASRFGLSIHDPQLNATLEERDLPRLLPKIVAFFDGILDVE